jgi:hypothetical protein
VSILKKIIKYLALAILLIVMAGTASAGLFVGAHSFIASTEDVLSDDGNIHRYHHIKIGLEGTGLATRWVVYKNGEQIASGRYDGNYTETSNICYAEEIISAGEAIRPPVSNFSLNMTTSEGESLRIDYPKITEWDYYDDPSEVNIEICGIREEKTNMMGAILSSWMGDISPQEEKYLIIKNYGFETFYGDVRFCFQENGQNHSMEFSVGHLSPGEIRELFMGNFSSEKNSLLLWDPLCHSSQFPEKSDSWYI